MNHSLRRRTTIALTCFAFATAAAAHEGMPETTASVGQPGVAADATRTVTIHVDDHMRFEPSRVAVAKGETVRFVLRNEGKVEHEFVLGDDRDLAAHAQAMRDMPDMRHTGAGAITLPPGATRRLVWRFTRGGTIGFACLRPGHYEAGMKGTIDVETPTEGTH